MVDFNDVANSFGVAEPGGIGEKCIDSCAYLYQYEKEELSKNQ